MNLGTTILLTTKTIINTQATKQRWLFVKALDHSLDDCKGLTQWAFVSLVKTHTYTTSNLNNLRKCLKDNWYIGDNMCNHKNRHPCHNLPQACRGRKSAWPVWIRTTDNLLSHLSTSFRINVRWSNTYYTHKSTINKIWLEQITWRRLELVLVELFINISRMIKNMSK